MLFSHTGKTMGNGMKYNTENSPFQIYIFSHLLFILIITGNKNKVK